MSLLLENCRFLLTQDANRKIHESVDLLIEDSKIAEIGKGLKADESIDCSRFAVMPGLINTHTHTAMTLFRGIADDVKLEDFLDKTYNLDSKLTRSAVHKGALLGCLESLSFGTTTFNDLYYFEDEIAKASAEAGIRAQLSWAVLDEEMTTQDGNPVRNCADFISSWKGKSELITPSVGVQGVYVASEETFSSAKGLAEKEDVNLHMHLSETRKEVYDHVKKTGKRPVEWLDEIGFLNDRLLAAHGVWLTKAEMRKLAEKEVKVSHNPTSNLKLASGGLCPVPELQNAGVNVSLGTDGCASNNNLNLFKEMKLASILQKNAKWDATLMPAQKALDMATIDAAKALGMNIGSLEIGKEADIILIDLSKPHMNPIYGKGVVSNIIYSALGSDVNTTIVSGKVVFQEGEHPKIDSQKVIKEACDVVDEILQINKKK